MLRIIQITDTHFFADAGGELGGVDVEAGLARVLKKARSGPWPPDLILLTGDLVQEETAAAYARLRTVLARLELPVYALPGNHDDKALLAQACDGRPMHLEQRLLLDGWQLIWLDSAVPGSPAGQLAPAELERLDRHLGQHPEHWALVCLHHQPIPIGSPWLDTMQVANGADFLAVLDRHPQVRGVLFGHVHQAFEHQRQGVRYYATPSTNLQFTPGAAKSSYDALPPGFRRLDLHSDGTLATCVERAP